eukprot:CAMPEP_0117028916 /NCGR_PEP_ID=MMETSP0472-20121206/20986_1 /TAXON_ID=693140 ORGANISM="Tiarina fusus, Strain LIS" /NCGR_SAMPLE_ID=MMETSP0472 /ASSEMBLY_ACC=CAM_ASM_000603 /LENGTH=724 /DNA_ID=CAMNT_0004736543 /DNA_START=141 /DNA_END=2315 /DNA_ORIENTATION=+
MNKSPRLLTSGILAIGAIVSLAVSSCFRGDVSGQHQKFLRESAPRFLEEQLPAECELDCCLQFEAELCPACPTSNAWIDAIPFGLQMVLIVVLILLSALFSGLTLGLMSLDMTGLEIVMSGDDAEAAEYARRIYPLRQDGNLLLCTLLLGNVTVNSLLSILLAEYTGGLVGLVSSTFLIVIFGEIVPQALCSRYALWIGSLTVPLVKVIRAILYPVAGPLGKMLDCTLGRELATTYSGAEMLKLLQIHVQENVIDKETAGAMTGALTYKNILVKEVMTPIERSFMLNVDDKLTFETIAKIFKTGFSRIPVYEIARNNIIGLLFVKDLIFIDPEDDVPIRSFIQIFGRAVHVVWPDDTLGDVLAELKKGRSHLAIVRDVNNDDETQDPFYEVRGIITLEDIIEKILGDSIVDETDAFMDNSQKIKVERAESFEWARLRLLDAKIVDELLSPSEVQAVTAHFRVNYASAFKLLTDTQLNRLVATTPVLRLPTAEQKVGEEFPTDLLYKKGVKSDVCTLILGGKVTITVGEENFRSELSSWSVLGRTALEHVSFSPDFSAFVSDGPCRCLQIKHKDFAEALDASTVERRLIESKAGLESVALPRTSESESLVENASSTSIEGISNRREKLFARIFTKDETPEKRAESQDASDSLPVSRPEPPSKSSASVRFEEPEAPRNGDEPGASGEVEPKDTETGNTGKTSPEANAPDDKGAKGPNSEPSDDTSG